MRSVQTSLDLGVLSGRGSPPSTALVLLTLAVGRLVRRRRRLRRRRHRSRAPASGPTVDVPPEYVIGPQDVLGIILLA